MRLATAMGMAVVQPRARETNRAHAQNSYTKEVKGKIASQGRSAEAACPAV
jgi:hypothetical protein